MPASGTPFLLELCPAYAGGMPEHHAHHHHSQTHSDFQDCPFGSAPAQGPVSQQLSFEAAPQATASIDVVFAPRPAVSRLPRAHPPRGPPLLV